MGPRLFLVYLHPLHETEALVPCSEGGGFAPLEGGQPLQSLAPEQAAFGACTLPPRLLLGNLLLT